MTQCAVWWTTPFAATPDHLALLTPAERTRYDAYRQDQDRLRFLTGRVLAKTLAAEQLGIMPAEIEFDATCPDCQKQHGPPHIPDAALSISISHSGQRIGVALTNGPAVGLDVEAATRKIDDALLSYALNDVELATIRDLSSKTRQEAFFTYWTRKEAVMKASRLGLRIPIRDLVFSGPEEHPRLLATARDDLLPESMSITDLTPGFSYHGAVAVLSTDPVDVIERWWPPRADPP